MGKTPKELRQISAEERQLKAWCDELNILEKTSQPNLSRFCRERNAPYQTLRDRWKKIHKSAPDGQTITRHLTVAEERVLVIWLVFLGRIGKPQSRSMISNLVFKLCGIVPRAGWFEGFERRHGDEISFSRGSGLDPIRAQCFNQAAVATHFHWFDKEIKDKHIPPSNIWNMDEKGIQLGGGRKGDGTQYLFARDQKHKVRLKSDNLELVTLIECVSAEGCYLTPTFIFSGTTFCLDWMNEEVKALGRAYLALSYNGWTDNTIGFLWFVHVFLVQIFEHSNPNFPVMLVIDGHESHIGRQLLQKAHEKGIIVCKLPAHTTHRLQPLDVGVYGVLQRQWQARCANVLGEFGQPMQREQVVKEYLIARKKAFKPETIQKSFVSSRLVAVEERVPFTDGDFAPSTITSVRAHVPLGFPVDNPTAEDINRLVEMGLLEDRFVSEDGLAPLYSAEDSDDDSHASVIDSDDIEVVEDSQVGQVKFLHYKIQHSDSQNEGPGDQNQQASDEQGVRQNYTHAPTSPDHSATPRAGSSKRRLPLTPSRHQNTPAPSVYDLSQWSPIPAPAFLATMVPHPTLSLRRHDTRQKRSYNPYRRPEPTWEDFNAMRDRAETAEANCKFVYHRLAEVQRAVATKSKPRNKKYRLDNPMVATDEGMQMIAQQEKREKEEELEKARRENERDDKKEARDAERAKLSDLTLFKLALSSKCQKNDLEPVVNKIRRADPAAHSTVKFERKRASTIDKIRKSIVGWIEAHVDDHHRFPGLRPLFQAHGVLRAECTSPPPSHAVTQESRASLSNLLCAPGSGASIPTIPTQCSSLQSILPPPPPRYNSLHAPIHPIPGISQSSLSAGPSHTAATALDLNAWPVRHGLHRSAYSPSLNNPVLDSPSAHRRLSTISLFGAPSYLPEIPRYPYSRPRPVHPFASVQPLGYVVPPQRRLFTVDEPGNKLHGVDHEETDRFTGQPQPHQ